MRTDIIDWPNIFGLSVETVERLDKLISNEMDRLIKEVPENANVNQALKATADLAVKLAADLPMEEGIYITYRVAFSSRAAVDDKLGLVNSIVAIVAGKGRT